MPAAGLPQSLIIWVDGTRLSREVFDKLTEVRVELSIGAAGHFLLRFLSDDGMAGAFKIGSSVKIAFDDETSNTVDVIAGTIESMAIDYEFDRRQLTVTGYDAQRKLSTGATAKTYTKQSYKDILSAIAGSAGLSPKLDSSLSTPVFDHLLQIDSDLAFVHRIATERGLEWLVDDTQLIVRPRGATTTVKVEFGERLRRLSARYTTAERPEEVTVTSWDPKNKKSIVEKRNPDAPVGEVPLESRYRKKAAAKRKAAAWSKPATSPAGVRAVADGIARRMASGALVGRGETVGDPSIRPGVNLEISGVDTDWNGTYYVTGAEHVYRDGEPYLTRFTIGANDSSSLVDLLGAPAAPSTRATGPMHGPGHGVTIGIVTNAKGESKQAEVKVKFPYLGDIESGWLRVATPWAGNDRGIMFMPEINDEVLVAFEHGDLSRGYVVGALWNGKDQSPVDWTSDRNHHVRVIRSTKGHELTFSDGKDSSEQFVSIVLGDETTTLLLSKEKIELIANSGKPVEVKNDKAKVVLTGSGDLQLEAQNITIKAKQKITLEGTEIATKSKSGTKVEAGSTLDLKAQAKGSFDGGATAEIKATAMVKIN